MARYADTKDLSFKKVQIIHWVEKQISLHHMRGLMIGGSNNIRQMTKKSAKLNLEDNGIKKWLQGITTMF